MSVRDEVTTSVRGVLGVASPFCQNESLRLTIPKRVEMTNFLITLTSFPRPCAKLKRLLALIMVFMFIFFTSITLIDTAMSVSSLSNKNSTTVEIWRDQRLFLTSKAANNEKFIATSETIYRLTAHVGDWIEYIVAKHAGGFKIGGRTLDEGDRLRLTVVDVRVKNVEHYEGSGIAYRAEQAFYDISLNGQKVATADEGLWFNVLQPVEENFWRDYGNLGNERATYNEKQFGGDWKFELKIDGDNVTKIWSQHLDVGVFPTDFVSTEIHNRNTGLLLKGMVDYINKYEKMEEHLHLVLIGTNIFYFQPRYNTYLTISGVSAMVEESVSIKAILKDEHGKPLSGMSIRFEFNDAGTWRLLGSDSSDSNGIASINYVPLKADTFAIRASFEGSSEYTKSVSNNEKLIVQSKPPDYVLYSIAGIMLAVIGIFGMAIYLVKRKRKGTLLISR